MLTPKVVSHAGVTVDLAQIKCFKLSPFTLNEEETGDWLIIELKSRIEYVFHPQSRKWEKETITDTIRQQFASYEQATAYLREWEEIWQSYLQDEA